MIQVRIIDGDIKMAHFAVAFEGPAATDPDSIALMVMLSLLDYGTKCEHSGSVCSIMISYCINLMREPGNPFIVIYTSW